MKSLINAMLLAMLGSLGACATQPLYNPPADLTAQTSASLVGSIVINPSLFMPNTKASLWAVDSQKTGLVSSDSWKSPVLLVPGTHTLTVYICQASMMAIVISGYVSLQATLKPGGSYTIRTTAPTGFTDFERHFVTVWIEDDKGASVTPHNKFDVNASNPPIVRVFEH